MPAVTFTAPCPSGHVARWRLEPPDTATIRADHFTVTCPECDPPPVVTIRNPDPHEFPRQRRTA